MKIKQLLIIGLIVVGIYARCANLDQKVYTVDEVRGILRASGYADEELVDTVYTGEPVTGSRFQQYQAPTVEHPLGDALSAFANNPEHPPLYYLLMRFCLQIFHAPVASRWLAVGLGLLLLPAIYWLCQELFESAAVGWSAIALIAVSPFHVLLAQEARQYTLWALLATVSSAFLLRSLRHNSGRQWLAYGLTAVLGLYSHLFFLWVLVTHGLYVLIVEHRLTQRLLRYVMVSVGVGIAFLPWVWVVATRLARLEETTHWASSYKTDLLSRIGYWLHNLGIGFIDFDWPVSFTNPFSYLLLGAVAYSTYQLYRHTPKRIWIFVLLLMSVSTLAQIVPDILSGGRRSLLPRYSLTAYLGIELAVAFAIAQVFGSKKSQWALHLTQRVDQIRAQQVGAIALLLGGLISSLLITQSLGWGKGSSTLTLQAAPLINSVAQPVVLTDADYTYILSLSYQVSPDTRFVLLNQAQNPDYAAALKQLPPDSDLFVYSASDSLLAFLQATKDIVITQPTDALREAQLYQGVTPPSPAPHSTI
ncbi:glycosyltransferase family 39 protein [Leptolyngbya sp. BC1307]|uniref:glycosyltransferase family 39 protein n=1 Tax=Leptolyngbya sp. BC1307 TaxID=2029589 RepID=UPI000EFD1239|nr:glycosyltransferase family 39 protein [Leptolyngbya sp. BC1307]